jgi:2-hydroxychromene-2-carboxylate isomerase
VAEAEALKLYYDYKSPFAYLAAEPAFALPERYAVALRWIPFQLRLKGPGERSLYSEWKARYSYLDARRWANRRGGFPIRGPKKVYDSRPALIGGLFAEREGCFRRYTLETYARFFDHRIELDVPEDVAKCLDEFAGPGAGERYQAYLAGEGARDYEAAQEEAHADHVFGVPLFLFRGEPFWGHDRMPLLEERLGEAGLRR